MPKDIQKQVRQKRLRNYLTKDFDAFRSEILSYARTYFPNKIRVILPTSQDETLWSSKNKVSKYGLNFFDYEIDICLKAFEYLKNINGITVC